MRHASPLRLLLCVAIACIAVAVGVRLATRAIGDAARDALGDLGATADETWDWLWSYWPWPDETVEVSE